MRNFNWLARLRVRKWFSWVWWSAYFLFMLVAQIVVGLVLYYGFNTVVETWSLGFWLKLVAVGIPAYLIFFTWGDRLKARGRKLIRGQEHDHNSY